MDRSVDKTAGASSPRRRLLATSLLAAVLLFVFPVLSQGGFQVGYAVITADEGGRAPVATALFSSRNAQGILVAEAGIEAVEPIRRGRIFVDQHGTRTGLALANPADQPITAALTLRSAAGLEVDQKQVMLGPREHLASFVDQLFPTIRESFTGSLTFETGADELRLAAVTLRQSRNTHGEPLLATLPVADLSGSADAAATPSPGQIVFPHLGAGGGGGVILSTQIILINPASETLRGTIRLTASDGTPLQAELEGAFGSEFAFNLEPNGTFQAALTSSETQVTGYAVVTIEQGSTLPVGTAIFQFRDATGGLVSEAGVGAALPTTRVRIFVDTVGTRTGVAIAGPGSDGVAVTFELLDLNGFPIDSDEREIPAAGHIARFADELFALPPGFTGLLEIRSPVPVVSISLKLTTNKRGDFILATLPVADLRRPRDALFLVLPQVGFGPGFSTRLIFIAAGTDTISLGSVFFVQSNGTELTVPLLGQMGGDFPYAISPGGARQLRPGNTATVAEIVLAPEVVVNAGNTVHLRPRILDTEAEFRDDFPVAYRSLDAEIAAVNDLGAISGEMQGFSTLTVSAGGVLRTATITVVKVTSGVPGVEVSGIAQDLARRLYLANRQGHTILLAQDLEAVPDVYAGLSEAAGYRDARRLQALFRNPSFLALNQANGSLYVSDGANHVIRVVEPGPDGRVETLAGTGQAGSADGSLDAAMFHNPQGVALDDRGGLWVADSFNHTIRRIDLLDGTVETIAGQAGTSGLVDGTGAEARFNFPQGIAVESESLPQQLERLSQPNPPPPPPVSVVVADAGNGLIRRVKEGGEVETIGAPGQAASSGTAKPRFGVNPGVFDGPAGVAMDPFGNIYVTEPDSGEVQTILTNGQIVAARQANRFSRPQGLVISESGRIVVADAALSAQQIVHGTPQITSVSPAVVSSQGGAEIEIRGRNFAPDSLVVVAGAVMDSTLVQDTQTIAFRAPALASGRTFVTVQNRGGLVQASLLVDAVPLGDLPEGHITTVAGGATFAGEGREATAAVLRGPIGLAMDGVGNLYIADQFQNRIRKVDAATGIMTTVAGSGELGFSGDGELATAAALAQPLGVAIDRAGNLYIADTNNNRVRRVDAATGVIATAAGNGAHSFSGDGGPATQAALISPGALAVDEVGNLFIVDQGNFRIRKVDAATGIISTVAGSGASGFSGDGGAAVEAALANPKGVAVDNVGNLFISDTGNHRIRKVDLAAGAITTVAGTGERGFSGDGCAAVDAALADPWGIAVDRTGDLFVVDANNVRVRKVDQATGIITTVAGSGRFGSSGDGGPAGAGRFAHPRGVTVDGAGNLFISDSFTNRVRRVDAATEVLATVAGTGESGFQGDGDLAAEARLAFPVGVAVNQDGSLFIADTNNNRVHEVDLTAGIITTVAGNGECCSSGDGGPALDAGLDFPRAVATDGDGNLFIADFQSGRIRKVDANSGIITTVAGNGERRFSGDGDEAIEAALAYPSGVAVDDAGNLFIADTGNDRIRNVDAVTGVITTVAGNGGEPDVPGDGGLATAAALNQPRGVTVDRIGNLFIADTDNHRIRKVDAATGIITTVAGSGQLGFSGDGGPATEARLAFPVGVEVDETGNLFFSDTLVNRIRKVAAATGVITTVAGNGVMGFSGDGGPAAEAALAFPSGVAVDKDGNLFIADPFNSRIRGIRGPLPD